MTETIKNDARFWNRAARKYAASRVADQAGYDRTLARTRDLLTRTDSVLELGCGTGTTALFLASHVGRILATDVSAEMIAIAKEKAASAPQTNAAFTVATPETVCATEGPFDAVLAFNLLHLLEDRRGALRRVHALLKPGGLLVTKTACLSEMNPLLRLLLPAMQVLRKAP